MGSVPFRLPSPSMAVSLLALFVALGGSSYAALKVNSKQIVNNSVRSKDLRNNDVRSKDVRKNSLTGADINEARLGLVPKANTANSAATATSAASATKAATADDANALGGIAPGGYVRTPTEPTRLVGTSGNPPFEEGFTNLGQGAPRDSSRISSESCTCRGTSTRPLPRARSSRSPRGIVPPTAALSARTSSYPPTAPPRASLMCGLTERSGC